MEQATLKLVQNYQPGPPNSLGDNVTQVINQKTNFGYNVTCSRFLVDAKNKNKQKNPFMALEIPTYFPIQSISSICCTVDDFEFHQFVYDRRKTHAHLSS